MKIDIKNLCKSDITSLCTLILSILFSLINIIIYACVGEIYTFLTMLALNIIILLISIIAYKTKVTILYAGAGVIMVVLHSLTNFATTNFSYAYLIGSIFLFLGAVVQIIFQIIEKQKPVLKGTPYIVVCGLLVVSLISTYLGEVAYGNNQNVIKNESWSVPNFIDNVESNEKGTIEEISYKTKAYATNKREVIKKANVYLPFNYNKEEKYNVLYLLHGTGNDENYWLRDNHDNKIMLDNLISLKVIEPLIVVTPTFYVENDCKDNLDELTYSFKYELRNDLMPYVETKYATYSKGIKNEDFIESRDHRSFAGLSRGAVTMYHSVLSESLDYFSYFGAFSGSRTSGKELKERITENKFDSYKINYLYCSAGTLDFALPVQIKDYRDQLNLVDQINDENSRFDVTPFKRHASNNWHLNLYNFLQIVFK